MPDKKIEILRLFQENSKILKNHMRKEYENTGITLPQSFVIGILFKEGEIKISELSRKTELSNSTVSGIIDRLERNRIVTRRRSETDKRNVYVKLTKKFLDVHLDFHKKGEEIFSELIEKGTKDDIESMFKGLNTMKKVLSMGIKSSDNCCKQ
jgi:DNA-binding MarR family transcriptional regulator